MNAILVAHLKREINKSLNGHDTDIEFDILDECDEAFACLSDDALLEIDSIAHHIISPFSKRMSQAEKVCAVYYALVNEFVDGLSEMSFERSVLKALKKHIEIVKYHAILAQSLLITLDIPNQLVSGNLNNEKHFWNLVQVNQKWYHLDATWSKSPKEFLKYPLVSDEVLGLTHHWDLERHPMEDIIENNPHALIWDGHNNHQQTKRDYS